MSLTRLETAQRLRIARAHVKTGWIKYEMFATAPIGGRKMVCALGALERAGINTYAGGHLVQKHLAEILGVPTYFIIPTMNDRFWTRKGQVLKAFDRAIAELERPVEPVSTDLDDELLTLTNQELVSL